MAIAKLTPTQAATLIAARGAYNRKAIKADIFAQAKAAFGIPSDVKVKVEVDETGDPDYLVLKNKHTGATFTVPDTNPTPVPTPDAVNPAPTSDAIASLDAQASTGSVGATTRTPSYIVVNKLDVFFNPGNSDEVVVRLWD